MIALLYDVHGNLAALQAVLEDAGEVDGYLLGGDYTLFGPWPEETLEVLEGLDGATWIRGNCERVTADPTSAPDDDVVQGAIAGCRRRLGEETVTDLLALPETCELPDDTLCCHASPDSDVLGIFPEPAPNEAELLERVSARRIVFGHTHLQFARTRAEGTELVNPGSVGMPFDGDVRAGYALLDPGTGVELRRVAYDHERAAADSRERHGQWGETVARRIETATL